MEDSMKYQYDLFVSYSTQNNDVANYLVEKIEKRGYKCFIAPRNISVSSGYAEAIIEGIDTSTAILLIFSNASNNSRYVLSEIDAAASRNKPIIPVRIENIVPSGAMEFYLCTTQWMDAFPEIVDIHIDKIISILSRLNNNRNDSSTITLNQENDNTLAENSLYQGLYIFQNANLRFFSQIFSGKGNEAEFQKYFNDCKLAFELFQKAADAGNVEAMAKLSECYYKGIGVPKDVTKAFEWEKKAAETGHIQSMSNLAASYMNGEGVVKDAKKAFEWEKKAAEAGHIQSMHNLAASYMNGEGVVKDAKKAFEWYKKAAEAGHVLSMHDLALCYIQGDGVSKDYSKAFELFQKAATAGYARSMCELALCYFNGEGVPKNYTKAVQWFQKAADKGHSNAMNNLAICYKYGLGVHKDFSKSLKWFQKAADAGNVEAINTLKICYREGVANFYSLPFVFH